MKNKIFQDHLNQRLIQSRDNIAIESGNQVLTYRELDHRSNYIANWIVENEIKKETFIGILVDERIDFIQTMIGILKAGCVFVPLDPAYPRKRLEMMVNDTDLRLIITDKANLNICKSFDITAKENFQSILLDDLFSNRETSWFETKPAIEHSPEDKIYIFFTSGTTGKPKAVVGKNKSLLHYIKWEINTFHIHQSLRLSQFAPMGFDAFLKEVFVTLLAGGTLCIPENLEIILDPAELIDWLEKSRVNLIHCVPGIFRLLNSGYLTGENLSHLKYILLSGETIYPADLKKWYNTFAERIRLVNLYGTTETTILKSCYFIDKSDVNRKRIPIGKPIEGTRMIVLDENMNVCDVEMIGEIYIRTPYSTFGYYNDPGLNRTRFIPNPFNNNPDDLIYKTGDLGRFLPDGNIECWGRNDRQVKIRGNRIEPEEIENLLMEHVLVTEAVVVKKEIPGNNELLSAYICGNHEMEPGVLIDDLRNYLLENLPDYMVPAYITKLGTIPRKPNGKVDYDGLPDAHPDNSANYVPPTNHVQLELAKIWSGILDAEKIGITDNFFQLGGNSLNVMAVVNEVHRKFKIKISLEEMFNHPTIEKQAEIIRKASQKKYASINPVEKKDYYPLSSAQKRLYILQQIQPENLSYNINRVLEVDGEMDRERWEKTFKKLIKRHESMRTSFPLWQGEPVQKINDIGLFKIEDVKADDGTRKGDMIKDFVKPFNLAQAPLLRVKRLKTKKNHCLMMLDMHHIVSDGISFDILVRDFIDLDGAKEIPALKIQYKDYTQWQHRLLMKGVIERQKDYWLKQFQDKIPVVDIPTDYPRPAVMSFEGSSVAFDMGKEEIMQMKRVAYAEDVTPYFLILTIYYVFLSKITGQEDIVIGTTTSGRDHADLENTVGMLANTLALRDFPAKEKTFVNFMKEVKERALDAFDNQAYQFDDLVEQLLVERDKSRNPIFDVGFSLIYLKKEPTDHTGGGTDTNHPKLKSLEYQKTTSKIDLALQGIDTGESISFRFSYCTKLFKPATIERFAAYFKEIAASVFENRFIKLEDIKMSYDLVPVKSILREDQEDFGF
jgi:amino acid adenylation domain-containing protein